MVYALSHRNCAAYPGRWLVLDRGGGELALARLVAVQERRLDHPLAARENAVANGCEAEFDVALSAVFEYRARVGTRA
jgi:hypothetical protein